MVSLSDGVPADHGLRRFVEAEMSSHLQEFDVPDPVVGMTVEEVAETPGEDGIGQEAAAGRRGVGGDAVMHGHLHLPFPAPPLDIAESAAVHLALPLRFRLRQELRAQGPEDAVRITRILGHDVERLFSLGHGTLTENLPGEDEIGPLLLHPLSGNLEHQRVAVDAGVHVLPVAVPGRAEHLQVFLRDVENGEGQADPFGGRPGLCGAEKGGLKGDPQDLDPLLLR